MSEKGNKNRQFISEKIVGRNLTRTRALKYVALSLLCGILFGAVAAGVFVFAERFLEIRYAKDKKQYLIDKLREHPEGIVIYDTGAPHAIFLFGYDQTRDIFYCADTVNSRGGRPIQLVNSIIRGETQQDKINTIDKIWFVVDQLPMAA